MGAAIFFSKLSLKIVLCNGALRHTAEAWWGTNRPRLAEWWMTMIRPRSDVVYGICRRLPSGARLSSEFFGDSRETNFAIETKKGNSIKSTIHQNSFKIHEWPEQIQQGIKVDFIFLEKKVIKWFSRNICKIRRNIHEITSNYWSKVILQCHFP